MFLTKYSRCLFKSKSFPSKNFGKTCALNREVSNEPLEKSKVTTEGNYASNGPEENPHGMDKMKQQDARPEVVEAEAQTSLDLSLVERKASPDLLLNADPFEEVPGPVLLKKISSLWKYLPELGCQATVSAMLSFFNVSQKLSAIAKLGKPEARPFDKLFRRYGPIVKLQGPLGADVVLINKPEHVAKVYDQEGKYPVRSTLDSVEKCRAAFRKSCSGPFNLSGSEWEEMRKALQEPLARGGEKYFNAIEDASQTLVRRIKVIRNRQNEVADDFIAEITRWSMECLCHVTLGKSLGFYNWDAGTSSEPVRLLKAIMDATQNICKCESGFQLWRFINTPSSVALSQACELIDGCISKHIRLAQVNLTKKKEDILTKEKQAETLSFIENLLLNECLSPDEVLTCIVDLLLLGVNTTTSALAFALYHLAQNQRTQRTLFRELERLFPEKHSPFSYDNLSDLTYLDACLNESLRLRMPMPILTRVLPSDITLSNFRIPKGTYMVMDVQTACLKEQNFEKSDKFLPERWLESSSIQPFSFLPFGHGPRACLGKHLAEVQLKTCLAKILRNYHIEYNYGEIQGTKTVISFPEIPLKLTFTERET